MSWQVGNARWERGERLKGCGRYFCAWGLEREQQFIVEGHFTRGDGLLR